MPDLPPPTPLGLTPYITVRGGRGQEAIAFYERAFGARELFRNLADDGQRLMHARFEVAGGVVMLSDDFRSGADATPAPAAFGLHLQVDDAGAWAERAIAVGCEVIMPVQEMFWGDRYGQLRDPFGFVWSVGSSKK
jgi:PhnB protein